MTSRRPRKTATAPRPGRKRRSAPEPREGRLLNLGPVSSGWLRELGVRSLEDVRRLGSVEICRLLAARGYGVSLNLAYALEGALLGVHWSKVPGEVKAELKRALAKGGR